MEPVGTGFKLDFKAAGLAVLLTDDRGIGVSKTEAGNVDGLHVGNKCTDVIAKWGNPGDVYGTQAVYAAGTWGVVLERDLQNHIVSIALTNIASNKTEQADQAK